MRRFTAAVVTGAVVGSTCVSLAAADWPMFRGDAARSGYIAESLGSGLSLRWTYRPRHAPRPAWPGRDTRMAFDRASHTAVADGRVFFGSSADGKVHALDAASGAERWVFHTSGPVRFTPAVWNGRVFVASDDGYLYCLSVGEGKVLWRFRGGPTDSRVLGNERMISRWPARGGPVVVPSRAPGEATVYFAAGIWPSEGVYLYALDAAAGGVRWRNATAGSRYMPQPHGGAQATSGVSVQGHLAAKGDSLLAPTGRAVPAVFDAADGTFRYFHLQRYGQLGGAALAAAESAFFCGGSIFETAGGARIGKAPDPSALVVRGDTLFCADPNAVTVRKAVRGARVDRKGRKLARMTYGKPEVLWTFPRAKRRSLIVAGSSVVLGTAGRVDVRDGTSGERVLSADVDGFPYGLAAAGGRLYVSTESGAIHCFGPGGQAARTVRERSALTRGFPPANGAFDAAAGEILRKASVTEGYCIDLGCGDGSLAAALARKSKLHVVAFDEDPANVSAARERLDAAGLLGARVTVHQGDPAATGCGAALANLVVSGRSVTGPIASGVAAEAARLCRPWGGVVVLGRPGAMNMTRRGPLAGSASWTHQYADPANSNCSADTLARGPLGALWFGDLDFIMPSRHGRGPAPLFLDGRMFVEGRDALRCIDAYNGRTIWEYPLEGILKAYDGEHLLGTSATGSNVCVARDGLYVRRGPRCLRLDPATGKLLATLAAPKLPGGKQGVWGYLARAGQTLFGSLADTGHVVTYRYQRGDMSTQFSESILLFALDAKTGQAKWTYRPEHSIRHNAIAVSRGKVFLIDRPQAKADRRRGKRGAHPTGALIALDAKDGRELWRVEKDIYGTLLAVGEPHGVLLMSYQKWRFGLDSELGGRMTAFRTANGKRLWDAEADGVGRPVINGRTIYFQPGAWDLLTGRRKDFTFERSYGCGILAGSKNLLVYRSATLGYRDLARDGGTENYGGVRPGCWINAIPAGGLVLMPDATDLCRCSYLIKTSIALQPYGLRAPRIVPGGGGYAKPVSVKLLADAPDAVIRYTLDGTDPTSGSKRYDGPVSVRAGARIVARAFADNLPPSSAAKGDFVIDPNIVPLTDKAWTVVDSPGGNPPESKWCITGEVVTELSNLHVGRASDRDPATDRPGTYRVYDSDNGARRADGELSLELATPDDDVLGVAFRWRGPEAHYVWAMDRQRGFHVLGRKDSKGFHALASNKLRYQSNRWYKLRVVLRGDRMTVFLDGQKDLEATDATFRTGTFALYVWGCAGAKFRNVRWTDAK